MCCAYISKAASKNIPHNIKNAQANLILENVVVSALFLYPFPFSNVLF